MGEKGPGGTGPCDETREAAVNGIRRKLNGSRRTSKEECLQTGI